MAKKPNTQLPAEWEEIARQIDSALEAVLCRDLAEITPTPMFVLVREIMRYPWHDAYREDPERVAELIEKIWAVTHKGECFWIEWERYDSEPCSDPKGKFVRVWLQMRFPPGIDPLLFAKLCAERTPMTLRFKAPMVQNPDYRHLLSICYHLQQTMWPRPVALPQDRLAQIICKSQQTISGYLAQAERSGAIKKVAHHDHGAGLAAKYVVATDLFTPTL